MMDMMTALEEKYDLIVNTMLKVRKKEGIVSEDELIPLFLEAYEIILPLPAKMFVKPNEFLNACLTKKDQFLKDLNKAEKKKGFRIVE